ncbi:DUF4252 domain-containing protein [Aquimarina sp. 2-A2]|uniref:DUF4252 domain-containing protein n=1 Tax=Aquimarina sp. 2-A2 TaxID=3382644 RepID=UPI00387EF8FC
MKSIINTILVALLLVGCQNSQSLQTYFVDHQEDSDFISVDIPASLLNSKEIELGAEEQEALRSIKKVNVLALPYKEGTEAKYETEKQTILSILKSEQYETLMRFGSDGATVELKYVGDEDRIDEVVIFASDQKKGLAIVRVLGDDIKPEKIAKLVKSVESGKMDMAGLNAIAKFLK